MGRPAQPTWPLMNGSTITLRLDGNRFERSTRAECLDELDQGGAKLRIGDVAVRDPVVVLGRRDQQSDSALDMRTREAYIASIDISIDL